LRPLTKQSRLVRQKLCTNKGPGHREPAVGPRTGAAAYVVIAQLPE